MSPKIAANPATLRRTASELLAARAECQHTANRVVGDSVRLAAAPGPVAAQVGLGVGQFRFGINRIEHELWQQGNGYAIAARRFEYADQGGTFDGRRYWGPLGTLVNAADCLGKGLRESVVRRIRRMHSNAKPAMRYARVKGAHDLSKRLGKFAGPIGKIMDIAVIGSKLKEGAEAQFRHDARRSDLSDWQLSARAALAGLANAAEALGEVGGFALGFALAKLLGAIGAVAGAVGGPLGAVLGGLAGGVVGFGAGLLGGWAGGKIGRALAPQIRKLIDHPMLSRGQRAGAPATA